MRVPCRSSVRRLAWAGRRQLKPERVNRWQGWTAFVPRLSHGRDDVCLNLAVIVANTASRFDCGSSKVRRLAKTRGVASLEFVAQRCSLACCQVTAWLVPTPTA